MTAALLVAAGYLGLLLLGIWVLLTVFDGPRRLRAKPPDEPTWPVRRHRVLAPAELAERTDLIVPGQGTGHLRLPDALRQKVGDR